MAKSWFQKLKEESPKTAASLLGALLAGVLGWCALNVVTDHRRISGLSDKIEAAVAAVDRSNKKGDADREWATKQMEAERARADLQFLTTLGKLADHQERIGKTETLVETTYLPTSALRHLRQAKR